MINNTNIQWKDFYIKTFQNNEYVFISQFIRVSNSEVILESKGKSVTSSIYFLTLELENYRG